MQCFKVVLVFTGLAAALPAVGLAQPQAAEAPASTLRAVIESIKLAKSDIYLYVADPKFARVRSHLRRN